MGTGLNQRLRTFGYRFASDERGNIAVIFAIMSLPMLAFVGAAVDYARASSARSAMQAALDSASLMIAKEAATSPDLNARAAAVFKALYKRKEVANVTVSAVYTPQKRRDARQGGGDRQRRVADHLHEGASASKRWGSGPHPPPHGPTSNCGWRWRSTTPGR